MDAGGEGALSRVLAISDEVVEPLYGEALERLRPDLVVSCGDLPYEYLENLVTRTEVALLYVPGNHDPSLRLPDRSRLAFSLPPVDEPSPGPGGCDCVDGRILEVAGLRVAGLGGSLRYNEGPNQYTQGEMRRRALALELRGRLHRRREGRFVDLLVTHAPPLGLGDEADLAHRGFDAFHRLVKSLSPRVMVHGHVHPHGRPRPDRRLGDTLVANVVGFRLLEL